MLNYIIYRSACSRLSSVIPADQLPARIVRPVALFINTDPHTKPEKQWVTLFIDKNGVGEYFDSYEARVLPPLKKAASNQRAPIKEASRRRAGHN
uniref:Uncharacterized protein n=1 Tax=Timema genevievae TaxID=629358 RepID=A0A7R9PQR6_TIMGE|nr:unnamed protein product [Timema genevievae]